MKVPDKEGFYWGMDSGRVMLLDHNPGALGCMERLHGMELS